jgi:hypothetical protein
MRVSVAAQRRSKSTRGTHLEIAFSWMLLFDVVMSAHRSERTCLLSRTAPTAAGQSAVHRWIAFQPAFFTASTRAISRGRGTRIRIVDLVFDVLLSAVG